MSSISTSGEGGDIDGAVREAMHAIYQSGYEAGYAAGRSTGYHEGIRGAQAYLSRMPLTDAPNTPIMSEDEGIKELGLKGRACNLLLAKGHSKIKDVIALSNDELLAITGMGMSSIKLIDEKLKLAGFTRRQ